MTILACCCRGLNAEFDKENLMNFFIVLYEKTGIVGFVLILLALIAVYLFIRNSLYLRWSYRDFLLFFTSVEQAETEIQTS